MHTLGGVERQDRRRPGAARRLAARSAHRSAPAGDRAERRRLDDLWGHRPSVEGPAAQAHGVERRDPKCAVTALIDPAHQRARLRDGSREMNESAVPDRITSAFEGGPLEPAVLIELNLEAMSKLICCTVDAGRAGDHSARREANAGELQADRADILKGTLHGGQVPHHAIPRNRFVKSRHPMRLTTTRSTAPAIHRHRIVQVSRSRLGDTRRTDVGHGPGTASAAPALRAGLPPGPSKRGEVTVSATRMGSVGGATTGRPLTSQFF